MTETSVELNEKQAFSLLGGLIKSAKLYEQSENYLALLEFVSKQKQFAPFNAMLLHVQNPKLRFVATQKDWKKLYKRDVKEGSRPLLILRPFGPVGFVFDVNDTEGEELPQDVVAAFRAEGDYDSYEFKKILDRLERRSIYVSFRDWNDGHAGRLVLQGYKERGVDEPAQRIYRVELNQHHCLSVQFVTLIHELAHLFLGHLGADEKLGISCRKELSHTIKEIEAESIAFVVSKRKGIQPNSDRYLHLFKEELDINLVDVYQVMKIANQVERLLYV